MRMVCSPHDWATENTCPNIVLGGLERLLLIYFAEFTLAEVVAVLGAATLHS